MATATLTLSGTPNAITEGNAWTVTISNILDTDQVKDTTKYASSSVSVTSPNLGTIFTIDTNITANNNKVNGYDGSGVQYVTFRSTRPSAQHPTTGFSLDLWSSSLYTAIITNNNTWNNLNGTTHNLSSDKYSLIYNYASSYPPIFSKGGTLTISVA